MKGDEDTSVEPFYKSKQVLNKEKKRVIARFAVEHFVEDNDIIILEAGTTVGAMIPFLKQSNLTVLTNGLGNLNDLSCCVPHISVIGCSGILRNVAYTFVGPQAEDFFRGIRAHTLFLSATGLSLPEGITDPNPLEIQVKRAMAQSASQIILLLDSSKFGVRSLTQVVPLEQIHKFVTDAAAPDEQLDDLRALGIEVFIAS
jgi:DeoR/GlpR family transcriptional regulator of sugar metabolism